MAKGRELIRLVSASLRPFLRRGGGDPTDPFGVRFGPVLRDVNLTLREREHVAFIGPNGAGKTTLALALRGDAGVLNGRLEHAEGCGPDDVGLVSFEEQCRLFQRQQEAHENAVFAARGAHPPAVSAGVAVGGRLAASARTGKGPGSGIADALGLRRLLAQPFVSLSSGEHRRLLIGEALCAEPRVLVLDEPFDGLDADTRASVQGVLEEAGERTTMVLITHRVEEVPEYVSQVAVLGRGSIEQQGPRAALQAKLSEMRHDGKRSGDAATDGAALATGSAAAAASTTSSEFTPEHRGLVDEFLAGGLSVGGEAAAGAALGDGTVLLEMNNVTVRYDGRDILPSVSWRIGAGENWALTGPNGCGKSTLVRLAFSDHPQRYSNDVRVMGRRPGNGASIWQMRESIGIVTPWLHLQHHDSTFSALAVVCSGFFDSTGLWQRPTDRQVDVAVKWLTLLGLEALSSRPFSGLSQGQQRLVLLARAMVKSPSLLLLDEPTHGLDAPNRARFLRVVDVIAERCGVVLVSHHADELSRCLTHHLRLRGDGAVAYCGPMQPSSGD